MSDAGLVRGLLEAARQSIYGDREGNPRAKGAGESRSAIERAHDLGIFVVGRDSEDERIEDWVERLWHDQDDLVDQYAREWAQHIYYVANHQYITFHGGTRRWLPRKGVPWRVRSVYNVTGKALNTRVSRLTENKPTVTVQAATTEREDIERAEYKETLFWYLWEKLSIHQKIVRARRWAGNCGCGYIKGGWDPEAGPDTPVTKMVARYEEVDAPLIDPATQQPVVDFTGAPVMQKQQVYAGLEEVYLDKTGQEIGPVYVEEEDPENPGETRNVRQDPPPNVEFYNEGEAALAIRTSFNLRWDRYTDDIQDSYYFQDSDVVPLTRILGWFSKDEDLVKLRDARPVTEEADHYYWQGLAPRVSNFDGRGFTPEASSSDDSQEKGELDKEYVVRETWIFPKDEQIRRLWGREGCILITVGGKLMRKLPLPSWARRAYPVVPLPEIFEEGNHYYKSPLRDIIPLQDDINRTRSQKAEMVGVSGRLIMGAPQNHQVKAAAMGSMPAVLLTYRSKEHKPEPIQFDPNTAPADSFYAESLAAVADIGNMNDASQGKLPSAGIAAKAIYALQYADERSISETSNLQDIALKRLAVLLDAITTDEYTESRKIRLIGRDRSYMAEIEISPQDLKVDVDYHFVPGSMLSRQKEAVRNELLSLKDAGLLQPWEVRKYLPTAVPDAFRTSYDQHEAKARRNLQAIKNGEQVAPDPYDNPDVHISVYEEFMLSAGFKSADPSVQASVLQLWTAFQQMRAGQMAPAAAPAPEGSARPIPGQAPAPGAAIGQGPDQLAQAAESAMAPPPDFGRAEPAMMN